MPKQLLTGTLDEQCEFLYNMAQEKMAQGNFTGAVYALQEVAKFAPDYKNVAELLATARSRKATQRRLVIGGFVGAALFIGIGTIIQVSNDLIFILLALIGLVVGYGVANWLESLRNYGT